MRSASFSRFSVILLSGMVAGLGLWSSSPFARGLFSGVAVMLLLLPALPLGKRKQAEGTGTLASDLQAARDTASQERQLRERHARWISVIAHEFKTPLSIIDTTASSIEALAGNENEPIQKRCHKIQRSVTRLNSLLNTYLAEERLHSGMGHITPQLLDVAAFMERTLRGVLLPPEPRIELRLDLEGAPQQIHADRLLLQLMLGNLLGNAVKFSPNGGVITLRAKAAARGKQPGIEIQVCDEGIGIAPDRIPSLFDHYMSGDSRLGEGDHVSANTGIGLWAVRESVLKHRGDIRVESQLGKGTRFTIWLPVTSVLEIS